MLDIAFSELVVIGVVALVVIGPEKLPKVARTAGILLGRAQKYVGDIKSDINRQIQLEELKALQEQMATQARELENTMKREMLETEAALTQSAESLKASVEQAGKEISDAGKAIAADVENAAKSEAAPGETPPAQLAAPEDELYRGEPALTPVKPKPSDPPSPAA